MQTGFAGELLAEVGAPHLDSTPDLVHGDVDAFETAFCCKSAKPVAESVGEDIDLLIDAVPLLVQEHVDEYPLARLEILAVRYRADWRTVVEGIEEL